MRAPSPYTAPTSTTLSLPNHSASRNESWRYASLSSNGNKSASSSRAMACSGVSHTRTRIPARKYTTSCSTVNQRIPTHTQKSALGSKQVSTLTHSQGTAHTPASAQLCDCGCEGGCEPQHVVRGKQPPLPPPPSQCSPPEGGVARAGTRTPAAARTGAAGPGTPPGASAALPTCTHTGENRAHTSNRVPPVQVRGRGRLAGARGWRAPTWRRWAPAPGRPTAHAHSGRCT